MRAYYCKKAKRMVSTTPRVPGFGPRCDYCGITVADSDFKRKHLDDYPAIEPSQALKNSSLRFGGEALYAERDIQKMGGFYSRHVRALTNEGLYSKSDIAAELGWRDQQIEALQLIVSLDFKPVIPLTDEQRKAILGSGTDSTRRCRIIISGSHSRCNSCGLVWDTNDVCPPNCGGRAL